MRGMDPMHAKAHDIDLPIGPRHVGTFTTHPIIFSDGTSAFVHDCAFVRSTRLLRSFQHPRCYSAPLTRMASPSTLHLLVPKVRASFTKATLLPHLSEPLPSLPPSSSPKQHIHCSTLPSTTLALSSDHHLSSSSAAREADDAVAFKALQKYTDHTWVLEQLLRPRRFRVDDDEEDFIELSDHDLALYEAL